ncbi:MAG: oxidoreductase [Candidatus Hydrogenedentota bacterium]
MSQVTEVEAAPQPHDSRQVVNDVVIKIATPNGSGSQSANLILMRSIFEMGVPVAGKNLFPSNIQGLPTWYTIRVNEHGWLAQRTNVDVSIAMNPDTIVSDVKDVAPHATLILPDTLKSFSRRDDINAIVVPFNKLVAQACEDTRLRPKVVNVVYVGVTAYLLGIEMEEVTRAIAHQFGKKQKAVELNLAAAKAGFDWAAEHISRHPTHVIRRSSAAKGKILIEGNEATALGAMFGGVTMASWYPITPSSSVCEYLSKYMAKYRKDPETGKATYAIVQAEDELAAMGMMVGGGWAGARTMTATSGPGISLMAEMAGLAYFAEIPSVIVDVQRLGPSTGLPTRTSQGDLSKAYFLSHGDCRHVLLIPGNMEECYEFTAKALDLAAQLQTLVFVMTDLDLGMNKWLSDPMKPLPEPLQRGKVLGVEELNQVESFARYRDVDGDGIPYRTLPGTNHPKAAYFTRGTGHNEFANYTESPVEWVKNLDRLGRKFDTAREMVPVPVVDESTHSEVGVIAYGSSDLAVQEARAYLQQVKGIAVDYLRIRALPVNGVVKSFIERHKTVYVVEQNRDAQMAMILRSEYPEQSVKLKSVLHYNGLPLDAETLVQKISLDLAGK